MYNDHELLLTPWDSALSEAQKLDPISNETKFSLSKAIYCVCCGYDEGYWLHLYT